MSILCPRGDSNSHPLRDSILPARLCFDSSICLCHGRDLNSHGITPDRFWVDCVYHSATMASGLNIPYISLNMQSPKQAGVERVYHSACLQCVRMQADRPLGQTHKIYCVFCVLRTVCPSGGPHRFALGKNKAVCFYPTRATCPAKLYAKWGYRLILHGFSWK